MLESSLTSDRASHPRIFLAQWTSDIFLMPATLVMIGMAWRRSGDWQDLLRRPFLGFLLSCFFLRVSAKKFVQAVALAAV